MITIYIVLLMFLFFYNLIKYAEKLYNIIQVEEGQKVHVSCTNLNQVDPLFKFLLELACVADKFEVSFIFHFIFF